MSYANDVKEIYRFVSNTIDTHDKSLICLMTAWSLKEFGIGGSCIKKILNNFEERNLIRVDWKAGIVYNPNYTPPLKLNDVVEEITPITPAEAEREADEILKDATQDKI